MVINKLCIVFCLCALFLIGCGGDGDVLGGDSTGNNIGDTGNQESLSGTGFFVVEAVDSTGKVSFTSNELSFNPSLGTSVTWTEPTRKIGDACITDTPISYRFGASDERGVYTFVNDIVNSGTLSCGNSTGQTDSFCGVQITSCTYTINASAL